MSDFLHRPLALSANQIAENQTRAILQQIPTGLPCVVVEVDNPFVVVSFQVSGGVTAYTLPNVKIPIAMWAYIRAPVQVGDVGFTAPVNANTASASGLGPGTATFAQPIGNLSNVVFLPISRISFVAVDGNAVVLTGVGSSGVVLQSGDGATVLTLNSGGITISSGGATTTINGSGVTTSADVVAGTIHLQKHKHGGVQTGGSNTTDPVP